MPLFCQNCGNALGNHDNFCNGCGFRIADMGFRAELSSCPPAPVFEDTPKRPVKNTLIWILAFSPLVICLTFCIFLSFSAWVCIAVVLATNITICSIDEKQLRDAGYDTQDLQKTWFIPSHLQKRAKLLGHSMAYFVVWCVAFGVSLFIYAIH